MKKPAHGLVPKILLEDVFTDRGKDELARLICLVHVNARRISDFQITNI